LIGRLAILVPLLGLAERRGEGTLLLGEVRRGLG
jgi:hypothetical protein